MSARELDQEAPGHSIQTALDYNLELHKSSYRTFTCCPDVPRTIFFDSLLDHSLAKKDLGMVSICMSDAAQG